MFNRGPEGYNKKEWERINADGNAVKNMTPHYKEGDKVHPEMSDEEKIESLAFECATELNFQKAKDRLERMYREAELFARQAMEIKKQAS